MKAGLEALSAYLIIFAPAVFLFSTGRIIEFVLYGGVIALAVFLSCLWATIQLDLKQRRNTPKRKKAKHA